MLRNLLELYSWKGLGIYNILLGVPGEPPVRPNLSIGDTLAGMNAVPLWLLDLEQCCPGHFQVGCYRYRSLIEGLYLYTL